MRSDRPERACVARWTSSIALGIPDGWAGEADHVDAIGRGLGVLLLLHPLLGCGPLLLDVAEQAVGPGDLQQRESQVDHLGGVSGGGRFEHRARGIGEGSLHLAIDPSLEAVALDVVAGQEKAAQGELTERPALGEGRRERAW